MGTFCQFFTELSARDTPIFSFPDDNLSKLNKGFSSNLLYALTLTRSGLGLLMAKFHQKFLRSYLPKTRPYFCFWMITLVNNKGC